MLVLDVDLVTVRSAFRSPLHVQTVILDYYPSDLNLRGKET